MHWQGAQGRSTAAIMTPQRLNGVLGSAALIFIISIVLYKMHLQTTGIPVFFVENARE
jgi:hypothetical protein